MNVFYNRIAFLLAFAVGFSVSMPAFAQALQAGVDFTPALNTVITAVAGALTVIAGIVSKFAVGWLGSKTRLNDTQFESLMADRLNDVLIRSIDYAETWAKSQVADPNSGLKDVRFDNIFLGVAVDYALKAVPDIINYFKLTPDRIGDMIKSRMNAILPHPVPDSGVLAPAGASAAVVTASVPVVAN